MMNPIRYYWKGFREGFLWHSHRHCTKMEKKIRDHMPEREIDKMIYDSFPASDPPSTY